MSFSATTAGAARAALAIVLLWACRTAPSASSLPARPVAQTAAPSATPSRLEHAAVIGLRESFASWPELGGPVYVLEAGPSAAPVLVLIHGLGENGARDFEPLLPELSTRYRILTFDLPGFGRSFRPTDAYAPTHYAAFIHALIERHYREPVAVLGHSMGGALALLYASQHPERVSRLALLDVAGVLYYREYLRQVVIGNRSERGLLPDALWTARNMMFRIAEVPASLARLERLQLDSNVLVRRMFSPESGSAMLFVQHDFGPAIRAVTAPTMLGWGRHDSVAPQRTATLLRYMLRPTHDQVFEASAHVPMQTEPAQLLRSLTAFLDASGSDPRPPRMVASNQRIGRCLQQSDRVFEGDYDAIVLSRCKRALLRHVRARSLWVEGSNAELIDVELTGGDVAATFVRADVVWTGGHVVAPVCIATDASELNLAGVRCVAQREAIRVHVRSQLVASVTELEVAGVRSTLHGAYTLSQTTGEPRPCCAAPAAKPAP